MIEHGISVYRYPGGFLHEKVILVDDRIAGIGTVNFDNRSFRINFEVTLWFTHERMIGDDREDAEEAISPMPSKVDLDQRGSSRCLVMRFMSRGGPAASRRSCRRMTEFVFRSDTYLKIARRDGHRGDARRRHRARPHDLLCQFRRPAGRQRAADNSPMARVVADRQRHSSRGDKTPIVHVPAEGAAAACAGRYGHRRASTGTGATG